jgi:hypothetical protein
MIATSRSKQGRQTRTLLITERRSFGKQLLDVRLSAGFTLGSATPGFLDSFGGLFVQRGCFKMSPRGEDVGIVGIAAVTLQGIQAPAKLELGWLGRL